MEIWEKKYARRPRGTWYRNVMHSDFAFEEKNMQDDRPTSTVAQRDKIKFLRDRLSVEVSLLGFFSSRTWVVPYRHTQLCRSYIARSYSNSTNWLDLNGRRSSSYPVPALWLFRSSQLAIAKSPRHHCRWQLYTVGDREWEIFILSILTTVQYGFFIFPQYSHILEH